MCQRLSIYRSTINGTDNYKDLINIVSKDEVYFNYKKIVSKLYLFYSDLNYFSTYLAEIMYLKQRRYSF